MKENIDYELVPDTEEGWHIRILTGEFTETVFQFGTITVEDYPEDSDSGLMRYSFDIISTPDPTIATDNIDENMPLQKTVSEILLSVMENTINQNPDNGTSERLENK